MSLTQRTPRRRGVLLLVVMALLALMATVTMTFVLVTGVQMRAARGVALSDVDTDSPEQLLDSAMDQVLRGTENLDSPIAGHSLLGDVYGLDARLTGGDSFGVMTGALIANAVYYTDPVTTNEIQEIIEIEFLLDDPSPLTTLPGYYDGRLITMLDGSARYITRRILRRINLAGGVEKLHVKNFGGDLPKMNTRFLINDRPFDGTGFGLGYALPVPPTAPPSVFENTIDHTITLTIGGATATWERALLPNHSSIATDINDLITPRYPDPTGVGGPDEDYDAPDYQNEFMAMMISDPTNGTYVVKPSFHDPALINYWRSPARDPGAGNSALRRDLARKIMFRPLLEDHPGFASVNPSVPDQTNFWPPSTNTWYKNGPWDVDNDGNGKPDSVWVDLGSPVQTDASGRQYKPLYAILCIDLDGRLNLNAHGSPMHLVRTGSAWPPRRRFVGPFADRNGEAQLPIGQGYGPADIYLNNLFVSPGSTQYQPDDLYYLMHGRVNVNEDIAGRYGEPFLLPPFGSPAVADIPMPGRTTLWDQTNNGNWGVNGEDDDLDGVEDNRSERILSQRNGLVRDDNFPPRPVGRVDLLTTSPEPSQIDNLADFRGDALATGSQADIDGDGTVISDVRGAPIYASHGEGDDAIDDPYEMNLDRTASQRRMNAVDGSGNLSQADAPFRFSDLEALLRINDSDIGTLSSRLLDLAEDTFLNIGSAARREFLRSLMTTDSWDAPAAGLMLGMPELLQATPPAPFTTSFSPFELRSSTMLDEFLRQLGMTDVIQRKGELRRDLYPRFFDGLKLDLNRPFGNSEDDDAASPTAPGFGVIDEPGDGNGTVDERLWDDPAIGGVLFDYDNDGLVESMNRDAAVRQANLARQAMARHLYILAMALRNKNAPTTNPLPSDKNVTARELAQWAINVVDFRDSDSIMTGFEYDTEPFDADGWSVDGDLTSDEGGDREVAWGCERPELLITETLAGHDRGTDDDAANGGTAASGDSGGNYDQVARPDGWLMIELYNPQSNTVPNPAELYDDDGLLLSKTSTPGGAPVWRMAFGRPDPTNHPLYDDTDPIRFDMRHEPVLNNPSGEAGAAGNIERTVYFTLSAPSRGDAGVEYYRSATAMDDKVSVGPGRYVVIGTKGVQANGTAVNNITVGRHFMGGASRPRINMGVAGSTAVGVPNLLDVTLDGMGMTDPYPKYTGSPQGNPGTTDEAIRPPVSVIIDEPFASNPMQGQRLSISEPFAGYGKDPGPLATAPTDDPWDFTEDEPWFGAVNGQPEYETTQLGAYSRVYLQRLANPTLAFDADTNPYLTVDSMPIDLWVYNSSAVVAGGAEVPTPIRSRERIGDATNENVQDTNTNIWRQWADDETAGVGNGPTPNNGDLQHTLGYLNSAWHLGATADHRWWTPKRFQTDNPQALDAAYSFVGGDEDFYTGAPRTPAPWLAWNNRPFISKYELMMVPKSSPAELLAEFSVRNPITDPYGNATQEQEGEFNGDYDANTVTHLLNFFHTSDKNGAGTTPANDLYRIFEFVDVPSRFSGTEEMLDPQTFQSQVGVATNAVFGWRDIDPDPGVTTLQRNFAPPFNYLSRYREPGKININTIFDTDGSTWEAILGGFNGYSGAPNWQAIIASRRGYPGSGLVDASGNPVLDATKPTMFARPFRSFSGGTFVPTDDLKHEGIESTLLRSDPTAAPKDPLFALTSASANTNTEKNPFFRYQLINRLPNMVTTRSNIYAVWITVGYFEVEPVDKQDYINNRGYSPEEVDRVFPDGVRLKGELGSDTGEIERHRAFYMVDRLVPVAFERGKTHNTRKTIRLRTMIE